MTNKTKKINKFIFYGTNSIFKKRMFELTKRTHDSVGVDYSTKSKFDHNIYFAFLESEKLIMQSVYKGFDTIVISSEVLYHIISKEEFNAFYAAWYDRELLSRCLNGRGHNVLNTYTIQN